MTSSGCGLGGNWKVLIIESVEKDPLSWKSLIVHLDINTLIPPLTKLDLASSLQGIYMLDLKSSYSMLTFQD